ncbi:UNVERIFIED_CONTAM: hypothetical protein HDU68_009055 [Siphonaria sp. JEL0065]|nr:hypothetical protein HDU68_009055 [Siphonaria sp. JEL0065]
MASFPQQHKRFIRKTTTTTVSTSKNGSIKRKIVTKTIVSYEINELANAPQIEAIQASPSKPTVPTTGVQHLPREIVEDILILLPLYRNFLPIALASKHFAETIFQSESFVRRHMHSFFRIPTVEPLVLSCKEVYLALTLPGSYQRLLLTDMEKFAPFSGAAVIEFAITSGYSESAMPLIKTLISKLENPNPYLRQACYHGCIPLLHLLLRHCNADPCEKKNWAIRIAAFSGRDSALDVLLKDGRIDPTHVAYVFEAGAEDEDGVQGIPRNLIEIAVMKAPAESCTNVVKRLLDDGRVDASENENHALCVAAEKGFLDVVALLLEDSRVNDCLVQARMSNTVLSCAIKGGHVDIVKLLLGDTRIVVENSTLLVAASLEHTLIMETLLADPRIEKRGPAFHRALEIATFKGDADMLKLMLTSWNSLLDDSTAVNFPRILTNTAKAGFLQVVTILVEDFKVNLDATAIREALVAARENKQEEIVEFLTTFSIQKDLAMSWKKEFDEGYGQKFVWNTSLEPKREEGGNSFAMTFEAHTTDLNERKPQFRHKKAGARNKRR